MKARTRALIRYLVNFYLVGVIFFVYMEKWPAYKTSFPGNPYIEFAFYATATLLWIVPVVMLYIFGWLVGWIVRGFKQKDAN